MISNIQQANLMGWPKGRSRFTSFGCCWADVPLFSVVLDFKVKGVVWPIFWPVVCCRLKASDHPVIALIAVGIFKQNLGRLLPLLVFLAQSRL